MGDDRWILGINTASETLGVALARAAEVRAEWWSDGAARQRHGEVLLVALDALLKVAEVSRAQLAGIAVAVGPGGFTGVRTALATAKSIALALELPLFGVSTLEALALQVASPRVSPMIDARKGLVFAARYEGEELVEGPVLVEAAAWAAHLGRTGALAVGDGALAHAERLEEAGVALAPLAEQHRLRAGTVARLGYRQLLSGDGPALDAVQPCYLREPSAIAHFGGRGA